MIMKVGTTKSGKIKNKGPFGGRTKGMRNVFVEEQMDEDKNKYFEW